MTGDDAGLPAAFFERHGDELLATELTRGPWDPRHQHGGPPSALLAAEVERRHARDDARVVRVTVELLRPVPMGRTIVDTEVLRPGRNVELLRARLEVDGAELAHASVWRIRTADIGVEVADPQPSPAVPPESATTVDFFPTGQEVGYHRGVDVRFVDGEFLSPGPATVWVRMRRPLVAGEPVSALTRVLIAADSGNGVSGALDYRSWLFVNPDLNVALHRHPRGEWVGMAAVTTVDADGIGLATTTLSDEHGAIGRGLQTLYVAPRR